MAYERQQQILAPGGLNLLVSGDLINANDSIALKNFRSDGSGVLRTRLTTTGIGVTHVGYIHTIYRNANYRWFGVGTDLYRSTTIVSVSGGGALGFDGKPLSMVTLLDRLFVMNRSRQGFVKDVAGTPTMFSWLPAVPAAFGAPSAQAGGALVDDVTYTYAVTYANPTDGWETNPSGQQTFTPVGGSGNNTARVSVPATGDARVTHWNVYRIGNTLASPYRVNDQPILIGTTTFDDTGEFPYDDTSVVQLGLFMPTDNDAPPAARWIIGPYYGRLIAGGSAAYPNRIWWTPANQPWYWPATNYADLGDAADETVAATQHSGHLRIYLKRSIWRLRGDPENGGVLERTNAEIGLIGPKAIDTAGSTDYFQGQEGIYQNDGDRVKKFSHKLDPLFRAELTAQAGSDSSLLRLNGDEQYREKACMAVKNSRLYYCYHTSAVGAYSAATLPNQILVCNLDTGDWASEWAPGPTPPAAYSALHYEGQYFELLGAGPLGVVYAMEYPLPESGSLTISHGWISGWMQPGPRERQTRWADAVIEHSCARSKATDRNLTVKLRLNNTDVADLALGSLQVASTGTGDGRVTTVIPIGTSGRGVHSRNAAVLVEGDCEHEVGIYSCTLHFYIEPRDAKTFDSANTDCGSGEVKTFDLLDLSIYNRGTVTWDVQTDLPGSVIASRQTGTFTSRSDRTPVPLPLADVAGRLVRVYLTSAEIFWLYSARLRYRVAGLYLSAADSNRSWDSGNVVLRVR